MHIGPVDRLGETLGQHDQRDRVREESLEGAVGHEPEFIEERAVEDWAEARIAEELVGIP